MTRRHLVPCAAVLGLALLPACSYSPSALESWPEEPSCGRYENRPAQLIRTYASIDGGPITTYYRVLGARRLEVFIDSTRDSEGSQEWTHLLCEREVPDDATELHAVYEGCRQISVDEIVS